jgi:ABC-type Fe3+ transport system substrate-binding protein
MMAVKKKIAISNSITAIIIILVLVLSGGAGYYIGLGGASPGTNKTVTNTTTLTTGGVGSTDLVSACATQGNSVTVYAVMDTIDWQNTMGPIWSHEFPQITVNYVGLSPSDIATRGLTEYQAGHAQADVFYDTLGPITQLIAAGAVQPYSNYVEKFENYSATDPNNLWHAGFGLPIVIIYNKNLVTNTAQLPTTYEQLNSSTWAGGKLVIDKPGILNVAGTLFASLFSTDFGGNNATWSSWMHSVAAGNPTYTTSGGDVYTAVSSGANPIGIGLLNDFISGNSPVVGVDWLSHTYTLPVMSALAKDGPHSACGQLFIQWSSSFTGQSALALTGRTPLMSAAAGKYFTIIPSSTDLIPGGTSGTYYSNPNGWAAYYDSIFGA